MASSDSVVFGQRAIGPAVAHGASGAAEAFPFRSHKTARIQAINVFLASVHQPSRLFAALYADARGKPASRLSVGSLSSPRSGRWNSVSVARVGVVSGATYWVVVLGNASLGLRQGLSGRCHAQTAYRRVLAALPASWSGGTPWKTCPVSLYVTGSPSLVPMHGPLIPAPSKPAPASSTAAPNTADPTGNGTTDPGTTPAPTTTTVIPALPTPPVPPINTGAPVITGAAQQAQAVTTSTGSWLADPNPTDPTSYGYQWEDCDSSGNNCSPIAGASSASYVLGSGDVGHTIRVVVTASNQGGSASATSGQTAVVSGGGGGGGVAPSSASAPLISSSAPQISGNTLSASPGAWSNSPTSFAYQWERCDAGGNHCAAISGATSSTYTLQSADVGATDVVLVTASNTAGSTSAASIATGMIGAAGDHTYYISYTNGNDANSGTSPASPWKHAPGMVGFAGTYTHRAGDRIIFEGGDTWPASTLPLNDVTGGGGTSGNADYFGVETDWFIGPTFTRPTFNAGGADISGRNVMLDLSYRDYIWVDDIEFSGFADNQNSSFRNCEIINVYDGGSASYDQNITINRIYVPNFAINPTSGNGDCSMVIGETGSPYGGNTVIENSSLNSSTTYAGRAVYCLPNVENNTISGSNEAVFPCGHGQISGNNIGNCGTAPYPPGVSGMHENAIESLGADGAFYIHDNVIHDTGSSSAGECEAMMIGNPGETDYVFNNVLYNLHGNHPGSPQNNSLGAGAGGNGFYAFNNSIEGGAGDTQPCLGIGHITIHYDFENNLCISNSGGNTGTGTDPTAGTCANAPCPDNNNLLLTPAQAQSDGYITQTGQFVWRPPTTTSPTAQTGANLTNQCTGAMAALCADTNYGDIRPTTMRPTGSTAWDIGAYEVP